ncbi:MAG: hypothetical protein AMXMBFR53_44940 [Gemmatimonadota bacterium]
MTDAGPQGPSAAPPREDPGGGVGFTLPRSWPFLALFRGLLGGGLSFWRPVPAGVWHDDGVYMLIGKALAQGEGLRYVGVPGDLPAVKFPPLYSSVLAVLWLVLGSVGAVTLSAELLNLVMVAAAGGLTAFALHRGADLRRRDAVLLAGLAFVSADVWRPALVPLSEPLFMALVAGALAAWPRGARPGGLREVAPLALLLAGAVLARSAGMALVVGFAVALLLRRGARAAALAVAPAVVAAVAWGVWASSRAPRIPEGLRDVLGPYGGWLSGQVLGAPGAFLRALPAHGEAVASRVMALLVPGLTGWGLWVVAVPLGVAAAVGAWRLSRTLAPVTWTALAYGAMLLVWPFVDRRLVAPLHPLVVVLVGVGVLEGLKRLPTARMRQALGVLAFAWVAAYASVTASRAARGWAVAGYQLRAGRLAAAVEVLHNTASPTAVVGAAEFWAALHLHGGWAAAPSARFTPRAEDDARPVWGTPREQLELWWGVGVDHVLLEQGGQIHGEALNLLEQQCPGTTTILARMPPQVVVRLAWDETCARTLGLPERR